MSVSDGQQVLDACPSRDELKAFSIGRLPEPALDRVAAHIEAPCPRCLAALEELGDRADPLLADLREPLPLSAAEAEEACRCVLREPPPSARCVVDQFVATTVAHDTPTEEALPQRFGNYELLKVVGKGGQGTVYRARQIHIDKEVALKLVNPHDWRARARSLRELKIAADLEHEHLVRVYHVGEHEGRLYFTMKLAEKGSLADRMADFRLPVVDPKTGKDADGKVWSVEELHQLKATIASLVAKVARAVAYIHRQGVIHRDLKPRNILLDARGEPRVSDLGLARRFGDTEDGPVAAGHEAAEGEGEVSRKGAMLGTLPYMAPEQMRGEPGLKPAVDIYSLGVILYKLLTDQLPFAGTREEEIIAQVLNPEQTAPPPSLHNGAFALGSDLDLICLECLAKEPDRRYRSAADLADDLERFARGEPISIRPVGWLERWTRRVVGAINHKLPIPGIARWGAIDLWDAGLNLAVNGVLFALIRTDQPPALLWLTQLTFVVVWWWMFLTYLFRHDPLDPTDGHVALLWGGVTLAGLTLYWLYCPPFGSGRAADLLAFYPPWTVVNGLAFLVVGRLYWGRYYLVGLAHFLLAALMPLWLDYAPIVYGVFVAACMVYGAWDHIHTARKEGRQL
jgi:serine/threonine-protein kinase